MKQQQSNLQHQRQGYYLSQYHMKLMHIMHLSGYALQEYISNELEQNPVLEVDTVNESTDTDDGIEVNNPEREVELDMYDDDLLERNYKQSMVQEEFYEAPMVQYDSLQDSLKEQIHLMKLNEDLASLCCFIIDEMDDDGYLRRPLDDVAYDYSFSRGKITDISNVEEALSWIQKCEPAGIGARDIKECLYIQLIRKSGCGNIYNKMAIQVFNEHYQNLIQHNYSKIIQSLNTSREEFNKCLLYISKLNPKPVTDVNKYELLKEQIIPDFEIYVEGDRLTAVLASNEHSDLYVNPDYSKEIVSSVKDSSVQKQTESYFEKLVTDAHSLINALKERETTMLKIIQTIVQKQPDFFYTGDLKSLRPMILQDIANATGLDISSVSRITSNKYVQTPHGIFPLKSLFMRGINPELSVDGNLTAVKIQEFIQNIINDEDKSNPYPDTRITQILKEKGVVIARRTVVKYRELMGIANSAMRKLK